MERSEIDYIQLNTLTQPKLMTTCYLLIKLKYYDKSVSFENVLNVCTVPKTYGLIFNAFYIGYTENAVSLHKKSFLTFGAPRLKA